MIEPDLRAQILAQPDRVLADRDVMKALAAANDRAKGENVIDFRGLAMQRLESRLENLEDTHRSVIAAAYDNLAGMNQVHRAVLRLLEPATFEGFMTTLGTEVAQMLRVDVIRLVLETAEENGGSDRALQRLAPVLQVAPRGFIHRYMTNGRDLAPRPLVLRPATALAATVYGPAATDIRSESLMQLDLGPGRLAGLLVFGSGDPHQFKATHGTDLLAFFQGVFERMMRQWLR
jgi:uncharacterized protein YigA (DUF484 family)